jgi:hypothetical protein
MGKLRDLVTDTLLGTAGNSEEKSPVKTKAKDSPLPDTPPAWAVELSQDLKKVAGAMGELASSDDLRKDVIQANQRMGEARRNLNERFDALQTFVETGKACSDCRATRRMILERMKEVILKNKNYVNDNLDAGSGYATKTSAFNAGWALAYSHLNNVISEIEQKI